MCRDEPRRPGGRNVAYKARFALVYKGLGSKMLPHEGARGSLVDGSDETVYVVVDLELKITRRPALLKSHNVCHSLATAPRAGDTECGSFQALDVLKLRVNPGDNCPV